MDFAAALRRVGYSFSVALAPKISQEQSGLLYTAHDYGAVGSIADKVIIMTYEWGYTYGEPMAVAPIDKVRQVLDYAVMEHNRLSSGITTAPERNISPGLRIRAA